MNRKIIPFLLIISMLLISCNKAEDIFKYNLKLIKERLDKKKDLNLMDVYSAILFLEDITKIGSHANANYAGRFDPTIEDYQNWKDWYEKNKSRLYWDDKAQKVKVKSKF